MIGRLIGSLLAGAVFAFAALIAVASLQYGAVTAAAASAHKTTAFILTSWYAVTGVIAAVIAYALLTAQASRRRETTASRRWRGSVPAGRPHNSWQERGIR